MEHDHSSSSELGQVRATGNRGRGVAGLVAKEWTPQELRHSFVSLLSDDGVSLEQISRLVGHSGTAVTEAVYRKQIRPVIDQGATAMERIFLCPQNVSHPVRHSGA